MIILLLFCQSGREKKQQFSSFNTAICCQIIMTRPASYAGKKYFRKYPTVCRRDYFFSNSTKLNETESGINAGCRNTQIFLCSDCMSW